MFENLLDSLNSLLLQHPPLLHLMQMLFWVKYWLLVAIMGVFIYLVYSENMAELSGETSAESSDADHIFIA